MTIENVNKYLTDTEHGDVNTPGALKTKAAFEKQNQKSGQKIAHLQHKLEKYRKKLEQLESAIATPQHSQGPAEYKRGVSE